MFFKLIGGLIFVVSYLLIVLEHRLNFNKSGIAIVAGSLLWVLVAISGIDRPEIIHAMEMAGAEIFGILAFLLSAMTLVEILVHYNFFDLIRIWLSSLNLDDRKQFVLIGILTFFLSAIFDNLTITIIMIQIARRFFSGKNLLITVAGIVVIANAGGAWSPIGDVTTIMLWLAGKFSVLEIISQTFLPSLVLGIIVAFALSRKINIDTKDVKFEVAKPFSKGEKLVITASLISFTLPLFANLIGLQPYIGLLFGLGVVWLLIDYIKIKSRRQTHLEASIKHFITKVDIISLKFFIGILLSVSALKLLGVLDIFSVFIFGEVQTEQRIILGNIIMGLASSVFDNVPLTAVAIDMIQTHNPWLWSLLALTVGTGGSLLVVGSVSGVVAMGALQELNFSKYLKIVFWPTLLGYFAAIGVWGLLYRLLS